MEFVKVRSNTKPHLTCDVTADALRRAAVPALRQSSLLAFLNIKKSVRVLAHGISRLAACPWSRPPRRLCRLTSTGESGHCGRSG
jgi:hypothetical protein